MDPNNMSIDKKEDMRDASPESMDTTPEPEAGSTHRNPENAEVPKRKGGRKPIYATSEERKYVRREYINTEHPLIFHPGNGTGRHKQLFGRDAPSTSSSWRRPFACTRRTSTACRLPTAAPQMSA